MNTISDIVALNREYASRHMAAPDRTWWVAGVVLAALFLLWALSAWVTNTARSSARTVTVVQGTY